MLSSPTQGDLGISGAQPESTIFNCFFFDNNDPVNLFIICSSFFLTIIIIATHTNNILYLRDRLYFHSLYKDYGTQQKYDGYTTGV